ncbi:hypothetical protein [Rhizobium sp. FKY42]|uniref:hypothetical protein n=1 Tax=Rhizobium sp. FKY42 TaxID=2562310 RepID=UPI0010BFC4E5|nr:hypothetical protein [Rhizobium sp. FKY42]
MRDLFEAAVENLHIDREEAIRFFVLYARFEYAAKECGYIHKGEKRRKLAVDPEAVAQHITLRFAERRTQDSLLNAAVLFYIANPPLKQVWDGGKVAWETAQYSGSELVCLLLSLAQMRNNLFHGGKGWQSGTDPARERRLLGDGLRILEAIISSDDELCTAFNTYA